jgi:hypothetical protein
MTKKRRNEVKINKVKVAIDGNEYYIVENKGKFGDLADPSNPYFNFFLLLSSLPFVSGSITKKIIDGELDIDYVAFWLTKVLQLTTDEKTMETYFNLLIENGVEDYESARKLQEVDYVYLSIELMSRKSFK